MNIVYNDADTSDKDIIIEGDKEKIIQVISNILDNAIKFTKEGTISIDIGKRNCIDNDNDNANSIINQEIIFINIQDTGKGIDSKTFLTYSQSFSLHQE